jgi:hypothetical protein
MSIDVFFWLAEEELLQQKNSHLLLAFFSNLFDVKNIEVE